MPDDDQIHGENPGVIVEDVTEEPAGIDDEPGTSEAAKSPETPAVQAEVVDTDGDTNTPGVPQQVEYDRATLQRELDGLRTTYAGKKLQWNLARMSLTPLKGAPPLPHPNEVKKELASIERVIGFLEDRLADDGSIPRPSPLEVDPDDVPDLRG